MRMFVLLASMLFCSQVFAVAGVSQDALATVQALMDRDHVAVASSCARDGSSCTFGTECCSGRCNANDICGSGAFCEGNGTKCSFDSECCSGICNNSTDKCSLSQSNACKSTGEKCTFGSECCEGRCNANDVCGEGAFCEGIGEKCTFDSECCSKKCGSNDLCT